MGGAWKEVEEKRDRKITKLQKKNKVLPPNFSKSLKN